MSAFSFYLFSLLFLFNSLKAQADKPSILNLSTLDKKTITITFDQEGMFAQKEGTNDVFPSYENTLQVPVHFSDQELVEEKFHIYSNSHEGSEYLGDLNFYCCSSDYYFQTYGSRVPSYITVGRCSFDLPSAEDVLENALFFSHSKKEKLALWAQISAFDPNALNVFSSPHTPENIAARCELIVAYIWSLNPRVCYPEIPGYLGLMGRLQALKDQKFGLLCNGFRDLFLELAQVLMPDVKTRKITCFRWYDVGFENIVVNSHSLLEVACGGKWWVFDPTFRLYFSTLDNEPINANTIRERIREDRLDEIKIHHIPTIKAKVTLFDDPIFYLDKANASYYSYFNWFRYQPIVNPS